MIPYSKKITYVLDDTNKIDEEINKEWDAGWRVFRKGEVTDSYIFPLKQEIEITFLLRNIDNIIIFTKNKNNGST